MSSAPVLHDLVLRDLVERWVTGWVVARRLSPPDRVAFASRIEVGQSERRFEFVLTEPDDEAVPAVAAEAIRTPGRNRVTIVTTRPDDMLQRVRSAGLSVVGDTEWMMWIDLREQSVRPAPDSYRIEVWREGDVLAASASNGSGELGASGLMALSGRDAIADRILTAPGHRRRGLGAAVMGALATEALAEGASTGILAASLDGERLYSRLGWYGFARLVVGLTEE